MKLYTYWRSSAAYRVRIALALKGLNFESVAVNIAPGADEQWARVYAEVNPQMRVPALELASGEILTQSMAIIDYLEETHPAPALLPSDPVERARCRAFADTIACDIHPLNNLSVLTTLREDFGADRAAVTRWYHGWIERGFAALESLAAARPATVFLFGDTPTLAEICVIPQMANARRFDMDLTPYPRLVEIDTAACALPAFEAAAPGVQPDAPAE